MSIVFDRAVSYYDQTRGLPSHVAQWLVDSARHDVGLTSASRLLEIGVGTGRIALPFAQHRYRYTGVDLSRPMMHALRNKVSGTPINLVQGDIAQLPFGNATFDAVLAVHIFHLVSAWGNAMDEAARVLRQGGVLLHGYTKRDDEQERGLRQRMQERANALQPQPSERLGWDEVKEQLARRFGEPHEYASPPWHTTYTPQSIIDQFQNRIWSATWHLHDDVLADVVATTTTWAQARWGDLSTPVENTNRFAWQAYRTR